MENRTTFPANMILQHSLIPPPFFSCNNSIFVCLNGKNKQRNTFHNACPYPSPTGTLLKHKVYSSMLENSLSCQYPHWNLSRAKCLNQHPRPKLPPPSLFLNAASPSKKSPMEKKAPKLINGHKWQSRTFLWPFPCRQPASCKLQKSHWWASSNAKVGPEGRYYMCQNRHCIVCTITTDLLHSAPNSHIALAAVTVASSTSKLPLCFQNHSKCSL